MILLPVFFWRLRNIIKRKKDDSKMNFIPDEPTPEMVRMINAFCTVYRERHNTEPDFSECYQFIVKISKILYPVAEISFDETPEMDMLN